MKRVEKNVRLSTENGQISETVRNRLTVKVRLLLITNRIWHTLFHIDDFERQQHFG